ncbi:MAG TPA: SDR family oxidoreductase [Planctomycetaceae bacterium]|nr:SDR family oxidoreductase [Planctomycetaceae bacterium]
MPAPCIILITGATRGLGRALVDRFVEAGHTVIGCGRSQDHVANLRTVYGSPHRFDVVDVAHDRQVAMWAADVLKTLTPDLLLNNAAVMNPTKPLWKITADEFQTMLDVNVAGVANVIRHFVPAMIANQRGVIVNFSSGWGRSTAPEVAPYCATKFAIEGLTQALAQELPRGMAAVPLNPGIIDTDMLRSCWADGAGAYPSPDEWSHIAAPFILQLGPRDNGRPATVPQ